MLRISVIVPMRNEAETIIACLRSLLSQTIAAAEYEIIVIDGESDDGCAEAVRNLQAASAPNLVLLRNPARTMPAAMNIGIGHARATVIMVAGAHTTYPQEYLRKCLSYLQQTGADVVGGPLLTSPRGPGFAPRMIAAILSSRFGVGNASFRTTLREGYVDTVPYGAYRKEIFERCGMYNEHLVRAQDCELHARIRHAGGRIYQTPQLLTHYHPVASFRELWRKAFSDGLWQFLAVQKNAQSFSLRRFVPAIMVVLLAVLAVGALFIPAPRVLIALFLALYTLAGVFFGRAQVPSFNVFTRVSLPFFALPFHVSYGLGTMAGLWHLVSNLLNPRDQLDVSCKVARGGPWLTVRQDREFSMPRLKLNGMKRLFDFVVSCCGLACIAPLLASLAIWIKLDSAGPALYRGVRAGRLGKQFRIYKLRTMVIDAERKGGAETPANDPRITRAGVFLRKYKLDELPQLINVLRGEMSLVGPRPEVMEEVALYNDEEKQLLLIRPGITDWASIRFRDEDEILCGNTDPHRAYHEMIRPDKVRLGLRYVHNHSFFTDISILFQTFLAVFTPAKRDQAHPRALWCGFEQSRK
jgi:lipopolysaccharide/colanic/teichoic acid biosynthesis glycosyltransferase/glycosyltransferase involved in cell wall biosynthesis